MRVKRHSRVATYTFCRNYLLKLLVVRDPTGWTFEMHPTVAEHMRRKEGELMLRPNSETQKQFHSKV